jgi:hypothetical protein
MVLTNNPDTTRNSITNGLPVILGYAAHSCGKGYNDLKCAYEGTEQVVATPREGTTASKGSYQRMSMNGNLYGRSHQENTGSSYSQSRVI